MLTATLNPLAQSSRGRSASACGTQFRISSTQHDTREQHLRLGIATFLEDDDYLAGPLVLAHGLRKHGSLEPPLALVI